MTLAHKTINSSILLLLMKAFQRTAGVISIAVLARLLTPEDFGIVAIATMIVFLFDILSETGAQQYIVQKENVDDDDLNTAWSLNILIKFILWTILLVLIPSIASFFNNDELINALYIISLILPISSFDNPGVHLLRKNFNYKPIMKLMIYDKIISLIIVLSLAVYLANYWAMIIGMVSSYIFKITGSYIIHDFKPRWSLKNAIHQWDFTKWILLKGILGYSRGEFDTYLVSSYFGLSILGGYNLMKSISSLPAREIIKPATEPLLASFSMSKLNIDKLNNQVILSCTVICLLIFPIATFMWTQHYLIVVVIFGEQWIEYSKVLGVMSLLLFSFSIISVFHHLLTAVGKVKIIFYFDLVSLIVIVSTLLSLKFDSIYEFTIARSALAFLSVFIFFFYIAHKFSLRTTRILSLTYPILLASLLPSFVLVNFELIFENNFLNLISVGSLFISSYLLIIYIWFQLSHQDEIITIRKLAINLLIKPVSLIFSRLKNNKKSS